ncbi:MAG: ABC transporter substrate-binding protein, partial [Thaumarchaeota archaeon]|nr:ABC transporter substrate-binding protein [Nitrososphaerota archaeon]
FVYAVAHDNITNVRAVAMVFPISPYCIVYNKAVISNFTDLAGKTLASFQGSGENPLLPIVLNKNGINPSSVTVEYFGVTLFNQELALGKVDASLATINQLADLTPVAASNNITLGAFMLSNYGLDVAGYALLTTTTMISQHPQEVQSFVNATLESVLAANRNPAAAIAAELVAYPSLNSTTALADFKVWYQHTIPNVNSSTFVSDPLKLGWIDPNVINSTETVIAEGFNLTQVPSPSTIYTNQFVHNPA